MDEVAEESAQVVSHGYLSNYKHRQGKAPLIKNYTINGFGWAQDEAGVSRHQAAPLYAPTDTLVPVRYGRDGSLIYVVKELDRFYLVKVARVPGEWIVPKKYVKLVDTEAFAHVAVVDTRNQHICVLEKKGTEWVILSMNPATTGKYDPPYRRRTPSGVFVLQMKRRKMRYLKDGTNLPGGYAPYASRFNAGGYIHGIPVNLPRKKMIEYSPTLGTVARSHMCVRNATSHAKFIYDTLPEKKSLIVVIQ